MSRVTAALVATLALTVACATATSEDTEVDVIRSMLRLAGSHEADPSALDREVLHVDTVAAPPARAWPELVRAWATLRLPVTGADTINYRIGGSTLPLGLIGGQRPSVWLDCGHGMSEANADQYQVTFSMAARVMPLDTSRSTIESIIRSSARPRDVSTESFRCTSLGTLELRIAQMIRQRTDTNH
jgi:hypothetical protein